MTHRVRTTTPQSQHSVWTGAGSHSYWEALASQVKGLENPHAKPHTDEDQACWNHWQMMSQSYTCSFLSRGLSAQLILKKIPAETRHQALFYRQRERIWAAWEKSREKREWKRPVRSSSLLSSLESKGTCCGISVGSADSHRSSCGRLIIAWAQSLDMGQGNQELHGQSIKTDSKSCSYIFCFPKNKSK